MMFATEGLIGNNLFVFTNKGKIVYIYDSPNPALVGTGIGVMCVLCTVLLY